MGRDALFLHMTHHIEGDALHLAGGGRQTFYGGIDSNFRIVLGVDVERIEGLLLTRHKDLFRAVHNEVSTIVIGTLSHFLKKLFRFSVKNTIATVKHNGNATEGPLGERFGRRGEIMGDRVTTFFDIIGDLHNDRRINRRCIGQISQTGLVGIEYTNLFRVLKTDGRSPHFNGSTVLSADEDLHAIFVGVGFFIQKILEDQNRILRSDDTNEILLEELIIGVNMMAGIGIGDGAEISVQQVPRTIT